MAKRININFDDNNGISIDCSGVNKAEAFGMAAALVVHIASTCAMEVKEVIRILYMATKHISEGNDDAAADK